MSEEEVVEEETVVEEEEVKETPEELVARLQSENEAFTLEKKVLLEERSGLGRKVSELAEGQSSLTQNLARLTEQLSQSRQQESTGSEYLDLSDPAVAKQWFEQQVDERVKKDNTAQAEYARNYELEVNRIISQRGLSAEDARDVRAQLEVQKDYKYGVPASDAEWNIALAREHVLVEKVNGNSGKKINLKGDKPVGTGVGGAVNTGTVKKNEAVGPEVANLNKMFAMQKERRGY